MAKQILLYNDIYDRTATDFINQLDAAANEDIEVRINCRGGSPQLMWGMLAKFQKHTKAKKLYVDGMAYSSGAYMCCYTDDVEGLDVSTYLLHRAAVVAKWWEDEYATEDDMKRIAMINDNLRQALEAKIDVPRFEAITGVTMDRLFSLDDRVDVPLTAEQAKEIGLINRITKLTTAKKQEITALAQACHGDVYDKVAAFAEPNSPEQLTIGDMTLNEFKQAHPQTFEAAVQQGIEQERERVSAYLEFADVAAEEVAKGIESGKPISTAAIAKYSRLAAEQAAKNNAAPDPDADKKAKELEQANADNVPGDEQPTDTADANAQETAQLNDFMAKVNQTLGLQTEKA